MIGKTKVNLKRELNPENNKEDRIVICEELCKHLIEGYSMECFGMISKFRLDKLIGAHPEEFPRESLDKARQLGQQGWESIGKRQADGRCLGNSRSWFYNMANRYGWRDKVDLQADTKGSLSVQVVNYSSRTNAAVDGTTPTVVPPVVTG